MRLVMKHAAIVPLAALVLAGCGDRPDSGATASGTTSAATFKACMVLDVGGVDDKSFNQSSYQGLQDAQKADPGIEISYVQSQGNADYEPNLTAQVKKGCDVVIAAGGLLGEAVTKVAKANPDKQFAIVDAPSGAPNVYGMTFKNDQSGFLAGYVAASVSKTGKVGTYGGIDVGVGVTGYMDGYKAGAEYYGKQKNKKIEVLGAGTFNGDKGFTDQGGARAITNTLVQQGADVVFPVAGGAGGGTLSAAKASGGKLTVVWVDFPGCTYYPDDCQYIVTSALKAIPQNVADYITKAKAGNPPTGTYVGDLANKGSEIDGFNEFDAKIPAETKAELDKIRQQIIDGTITIPLRKAGS
ncbi:MAG: BMP family lipoprotein [Angustibacter sp.]